MAETIWTQADIDRLKAAIASGALSVTYGSPPRTTTYQSLPAMRALLAEMVRQVKGTPTFRDVTFNKGFDTSSSDG